MSNLRFAFRVVCVLACMSILFACTTDDVNVDFDGGFEEDFVPEPDASNPDASPGPDDDDDGGAEPLPDASIAPDASDLDEHEVPLRAAMFFPHDLAAATCGALRDCYGDEALLTDVLGGRSCERYYTSRLENGELHYLDRSIVAGRVVYDGALFQACVADVRALACDVRSARLPASCEILWRGTVELLGECAIHDDCADDGYCDRQTADACIGECAVRRGRNAECAHDDDEQCSDGLLCFEGTCQPLGAIGDACGVALPGCEPGLYCDGTGDDATCAAVATLYFRELDEACDRNGMLCARGLVCESTTGAMGVCKEPVGKGAECKRSDPNQCPSYQYCDAELAGETGTCRDRPADGEACLDRTQACAEGHACVDGTCRLLRAIDEPCASDEECVTGACSVAGLCDGPLACGEP